MYSSKKLVEEGQSGKRDYTNGGGGKEVRKGGNRREERIVSPRVRK